MPPTDLHPDRPVTETDIQAYADGALSPERTAPLGHYLAAQPGEGRRVAFYGRLNEQIRQAFPQGFEAAEAAARVAAHAAAPGRARIWMPRRRRRAALWVTLLLLLASIAASGWLVASQVTADALDSAAIMALTVAAAGGTAAGSTRTVTEVSGSAPDLSTAGFRLVSHRILRLGPLARATEFDYVNAIGQPAVLLVAPALMAPDRPQWRARRIGDTRLLVWTAGWRRQVLAGGALTAGLMTAADAITLHRPPPAAP